MKKTNGKIIVTVTGFFYKYRLDILAKTCPNIKDFIIILTDKWSYKFYEEYHNHFYFVIMDTYRNDFSVKYELIPPFDNECEFITKIKSFYSVEEKKLYPYDIHRFIFPFLIEQNILNFVIVDSDFIMKNNFSTIEEYFNLIPKNSLNLIKFEDMNVYGPEYLWNNLQTKYVDLDLNIKNKFISGDGWIRGFHFSSVKHMNLFFNLWNDALEYSLLNLHVNNGHQVIAQTEHISTNIMQIFEYNFGYNFFNSNDMLPYHFSKIGKHVHRPEDTLYTGKINFYDSVKCVIDGKETTNFDYSNTNSISDFIKNNKPRLVEYYLSYGLVPEVTDTHVYTYYEHDPYEY
jgi:hypothetical protein